MDQDIYSRLMNSALPQKKTAKKPKHEHSRVEINENVRRVLRSGILKKTREATP